VKTDGIPCRIRGFDRRVCVPAFSEYSFRAPPRIHKRRQCCTSWLIKPEVPLPVISQALGHESIQMTIDICGRLDRTMAPLPDGNS
jgi:hypothetical protein